MIRYIDEAGMIAPDEVCDFGHETAVTAFSDFLFDEIKERYAAERIGVIKGGVDLIVYSIDVGGKRVLLYKSGVGAPAAAMAMEEIGACGVKNFVAFGICGALTDVPPRTVIVPDKAFRDDGTSLHYLPDSEFIPVKNADRVRAALAASGINTLAGGVWTTDGFYRETRTRADEMRARGCVAVDMECSALQAVCDFRGKNFYTFFITADSLAGEEWNPNYICNPGVTSADKVAVAAAASLATSL